MASSVNAVVTGASRGIGFAIARAMRTRGATVAMIARGRAKLEVAAAEVDGWALPGDVGSETDVERLVSEIQARFGGAPDVLVNAAGAFALTPIAKTDLAAFDQMIAANLRAPFALMRAFLPGMLERGSGHIISIGSVAGRTAFPGNGAYSASKYGLRGLHEVLEQELRGTGVRATLIEPAATDTPLWESVDYAQNPGLPERSAMLAPEAVAAAVMFVMEQPAHVGIKYMGIERS